MILDDLMARSQPVAAHRPFPRAVVAGQAWRAAINALAKGDLTLSALFGDGRTVHMVALAEDEGRIGVLSLDCPNGLYPSVGESHPAAIRLERAIHDLNGLEGVGLPDKRSWLDHGRWGIARPLGDNVEAREEPPAYRFLPVEGSDLHQIPVGPVHAGIIEPGHFRFTANGETVVRLEERLGYVHKGLESLCEGADLIRASRLAGRASGDSTVAYAFAFARAAEAALRVEAPERAVWLRALMSEVERLANHFGDIGAICNDASFALMHAHCAILRERVLRFADKTFGHRLMMDRIIPGGVAVDMVPGTEIELRDLIGTIRGVFPGLVSLYDNTASLQDRTVGTGVLTSALARSFGAGGYVGRASGRAFDARRAFRYAPYDRLTFETPVLTEGDVNARVWIRIREVEQSLSLIEQIVSQMPAGPLRVELPSSGGEGLGIIEGFRGDVLVWLRLGADGKVERCHLRDPSWFQWPLLEAAIEGNIVADFPLCNKSFNCSYSGHDV